MVSPRRYLSPTACSEEQLSDYAEHAPSLLSLVAKFAQLDALQQLLLLICAQMTPEGELASCAHPLPWYELYFALDANEDGRIDIAEFVDDMRSLIGQADHVSEEDLTALAHVLDLDSSGAIEWIEWIAVPLVAAIEQHRQIEPLLTVFRVLDRPSSDGIIGVADLLAVSTGDSDEHLSSNRVRDVACRMLSQWSSSAPVALSAPVLADSRMQDSPRRKRRGRAQPPPSLSFADMQRMMLAMTSVGAKEWYGSTLPSGGWFSCCQTEVPSPPQVLVQQQRALPTAAVHCSG